MVRHGLYKKYGYVDIGKLLQTFSGACGTFCLIVSFKFCIDDHVSVDKEKTFQLYLMPVT